MDDPVKQLVTRRAYDMSRRSVVAAETRRSIVAAARELFPQRGYAGTTMAAIAEAAGVSHETVYAAFGPKAVLFRHLIETALSGTEEPVPALERDIVRQVKAEPDPRRIIELFAHTVRTLQERLAPLFSVLSAGADADPGLRGYAEELRARRAQHMRLFVEDLAAKSCLRDGLSVDVAADVIWIMNSPEFYLLCVRDRRWSSAFFEVWLTDAWKRLLLPSEPATD